MARTVLIVDDDAATCRLYTGYLGPEHEAVSCESGVEAVELVEARAIDLVLMDLNLPGLDGWMAMSLIRARRPTMPFLIVTGRSDPELEGRARTAGTSGFLHKPVTREQLRRAVNRVLA